MSEEMQRDRLFSTLEHAVQAEVAPGLVALVQVRGAQLYHEAHGVRASIDAGGQAGDWVGQAVARDDLFDLASLTKVLCTTILAAQLVQEGSWQLDAPLPTPCDRPFPETTLFEILAHCSGFAAHLPFYVDYAWPSAESRDSLLHRVLETSAAYPAKSKAVYSDLGFITLGAAIEWHYGQRLDQVFEQKIARPLGLDLDPQDWVGFLPLDTPTSLLSAGVDARVLPTEVYKDPDGANPGEGDYQRLRYRWSGDEHWARGQVHDDNAFCLLGVAGHAGLFGTASGVARIARAWIDGAPLGISPKLSARFEARANPELKDSTRCLGWDGVSQDSPLSDSACCHLGYTGTGLWFERGCADAIYVLLSHRVHAGRGDAAAIRALRREFCRQGHAWALEVG